MAARFQLTQQTVQGLELSTVILDEAKVGELGPHVGDDAMKAAGVGSQLMGQSVSENGFFQDQGGWRVRGVQRNLGGLHRRHSKYKPLNDGGQLSQALLCSKYAST